jgi:hypothetical protein
MHVAEVPDRILRISKKYHHHRSQPNQTPTITHPQPTPQTNPNLITIIPKIKNNPHNTNVIPL